MKAGQCRSPLCWSCRLACWARSLRVSLMDMQNDVFFKVGMITIIGLSAKNAILIVEFAKQMHEGGKGLVEATLEASRMRLRPILMTSLAFTLGVYL